MEFITMTYNPITGVQYSTTEIPDQEIMINNAEKAAAMAYDKAQQTHAKRVARIHKNNTKHK